MLVWLAWPAAAAKRDVEVRIGLSTGAGSAVLGPGKFRVRDVDTGGVKTVAWDAPVTARPEGRGIRLGGALWGRKLAVEPADDDSRLRLDGRFYRGRIYLLRRDASARLTLLNELGLEDYVRGILLHEANPDWPAEALKVQAVVCRTYAFKSRGRHAADGFDLCPQTHCQVYGGSSSERDSTDRAVRETRGRVVTFRGEPISAVFHSCCGGSTDESSNIWEGSPLPYLKAVRCRWCRGSPRFEWTARLSASDVASRLRAQGRDVGRVRGFKVLSRSRSGRAYRVRVIGDRGRADLRANVFRTWMDGGLMRSTLWTAVSTGRDAWSFKGRGWGHGVGLCQWGAKAMADKGHSYAKILSFYYVGTKTGELSDAVGGDR
jgi:stage II sporulation protein D